MSPRGVYNRSSVKKEAVGKVAAEPKKRGRKPKGLLQETKMPSDKEPKRMLSLNLGHGSYVDSSRFNILTMNIDTLARALQSLSGAYATSSLTGAIQQELSESLAALSKLRAETFGSTAELVPASNGTAVVQGVIPLANQPVPVSSPSA